MRGLVSLPRVTRTHATCHTGPPQAERRPRIAHWRLCGCECVRSSALRAAQYTRNYLRRRRPGDYLPRVYGYGTLYSCVVTLNMIGTRRPRLRPSSTSARSPLSSPSLQTSPTRQTRITSASPIRRREPPSRSATCHSRIRRTRPLGSAISRSISRREIRSHSLDRQDRVSSSSPFKPPTPLLCLAAISCQIASSSR